MPAPISATSSLSLERSTRLPPTANSSSGEYRTGVAGRSVRRYEMPSVSASAATSLAVWFASLGCSTVDPWIARKDAMSSRPIWDGPSSPIETPAWEPQSTSVARLTAAMRAKS